MRSSLFHLVLALASLGIVCSATRAATPADFVGRWEWTEFNANLQQMVLRVDVTTSGAITNIKYDDGLHAPTLTTATMAGQGLRFPITEWGQARTITLFLTGRVENQAPPPAVAPAVYTATLNGQPINYTGPLIGSSSVTIEDFLGRWRWTRTTSAGQSIAVQLDVKKFYGNFSFNYTEPNLIRFGTDASTVNDALVLKVPEDGETHTLVLHHTDNGVEDWRGQTIGGGIPGMYLATWSALPDEPPLNGGGGSYGLPTELQVSVSPPPSDSRLNPSTGTADPGSLIPGLVLKFTSGTGNHDYADLGKPVNFSAVLLLSQSPAPTPTWQWSKDGTPIPGATNSNFEIASAELASNGRYSCTRNDGQSTSTWATQLEVRNPPLIVAKSGDVADAIGKPLHLSVRATCAGAPIRFQWYRNGNELPGVTSGNLTSSAGPVDSTSTYDIAMASESDLGEYKCDVTCYGGTTTAMITVATAAKIATQPQSKSVLEGAYVDLHAELKTFGSWVSCQWLHDGVPIPGATSGSYGIKPDGTPDPAYSAGPLDIFASYSIQSRPFDTGTYTCRFTTATGTLETDAAQVEVGPLAHLVNLSTRLPAGGTAGAPFCGFVLRGSQTMPVLLRAVGPTLASFGLAGTLPQPIIRLHRPDGSIPAYGGWQSSRSADMTAIGAFGLEASLDTATFLTLDHGLYTAEVGDADVNKRGIVLVEVYDDSANHPADSQLINASTRGFVGQADQAMFAGFVVRGAGSVKLLIRAVGPGLAQFGISDAITDPKIEVFQGSAKIGENDDWGTRTDGRTAAEIKSISDGVGAFGIDTGSKDAVVLRDFAAGTYSAQITGADGGTGTAIVEIYVVK